MALRGRWPLSRCVSQRQQSCRNACRPCRHANQPMEERGVWNPPMCSCCCSSDRCCRNPHSQTPTEVNGQARAPSSKKAAPATATACMHQAMAPARVRQLLARRPAAVDGDAGAGDGRRVGAAEVHHHGSQVLGLHKLLGGLVRQHDLVDDLGGPNAEGARAWGSVSGREAAAGLRSTAVAGARHAAVLQGRTTTPRHSSGACHIAAPPGTSRPTPQARATERQPHLLLRDAARLGRVLELVAHQVWVSMAAARG